MDPARVAAVSLTCAVLAWTLPAPLHFLAGIAGVIVFIAWRRSYARCDQHRNEES